MYNLIKNGQSPDELFSEICFAINTLNGAVTSIQDEISKLSSLVDKYTEHTLDLQLENKNIVNELEKQNADINNAYNYINDEARMREKVEVDVESIKIMTSNHTREINDLISTCSDLQSKLDNLNEFKKINLKL